jgi:rhodanese-related sulfurtransferase/rubrerythrin
MIQLKRLFKPVKNMDSNEARAFIENHAEGTFTILDVRQPQEYEAAHIPGTKLVPLPQLSDALDELDPESPTIVYCAVGGRSRVAAQMLSGLGFKEIYNLKGGMKVWEGFQSSGPRELNMDLVRGDEGPVEMIRLAYSLETGLQTFYKNMEKRTKIESIQSLFAKLVQLEENHKKRLSDLYEKIESSGRDLEGLESDSGLEIMEGGFNIEAFTQQNAPFLDTPHRVIDLAMMLETQALDLYLRFSQKTGNKDTKRVLFKLADEEKAHLALLGHWLEEKTEG